MAEGSRFLQEKSARRKKRVRSRITGTPERPRLSVFRSLKEMYAQLVDDLNGKTITGLSTLSPAVKEKQTGKKISKTERAKLVGLLIAQTAKSKGIEKVVFDRNRYVYHGRVKALADGAREGGLKF
jgi:large subunit ribosomal protein L18